MKVATSASYFMVPVVRKILESCELVLTTQDPVERGIPSEIRCVQVKGGFATYDRYEIRAMVVEYARRVVLPDEPLEIITFGDLRKAIKQSLQEHCVETAKELTEYCGWTSSPQLLYDEECIEGLEWSSRNTTKTHTSLVGEIPDEVIDAMVGCF